MEPNNTNSSLDGFTAPKGHKICSQEVQDFGYGMEHFLLNVNLVLCLFGIFANVLNILVYSRKKMRESVINLILLGISVSDLVVLSSYIPQYLAKSELISEKWPYFVAFAWIEHEYFLAVFHNMSIWMTTILATARFVAVIFPLKSRDFCTRRNAKIALAIITLVNLTITIPGYVDASIVREEKKEWDEGGCGSIYCARWKPITTLRKIEFWYQGLTKLLPAIWMIIVTITLTRSLNQVQKKRKTMRSDSTQISDQKSFNKTTKMLLFILVLFLVTEVPPSLAQIAEIFLDKEYYFECRRPFHYLFLLLYYCSGAFNFLIYITLSENYRQTLDSIFNTKVFQRRQGASKGSELSKNSCSTKSSHSSNAGMSTTQSSAATVSSEEIPC